MSTQQSEWTGPGRSGPGAGGDGAARATDTASARRLVFPPGFVWGAATASFQIEGSTTADGRGPSIWDTFAAVPGNVNNGDTGEPATDHYRRYQEDVRLMRELGLGAYRFSVAWPRVQPSGGGKLNQTGLDFYSRLVDELLESGIEPWVTLYHWDLPQPLEDEGGWPNRDTALRFADYAAVVYGVLGDRVRRWSTLNEPWCSAFLGYAAGVHAPGRREPDAAIAATHHLLLGHGLAAAAIREQAGQFDQPPYVGLVHNQQAFRPYSEEAGDLDAARRLDGIRNRIFTDPLYHGRYPSDVVADLAEITDFGFVRDGDLETIAAPLDMFGVNFYGPDCVAQSVDAVAAEHRPAGAAGDVWVGSEHVAFVSRGLPTTAMGWEIDASGLYDVLTRLAADYPGIPLYITENGAAFDDTVDGDGSVHDENRRWYLEQHVREAHRAREDGVPLWGYFAWSLLDNFEWAFGYDKRFGLVYVDYTTQRRVVKDSGHWYATVARSGELAHSS